MKGKQPRIIAGQWRGRKLPVIDAEGLRPTPDRIRETVFNWLSNDCRDAEVLDCFAGSGTLVLEALSRGAGRAIAVEQNRTAAKSLREQGEIFKAQDLEVIRGNVIDCIPGLKASFDLVFIDPPYAKPALRAECCGLLEQHQKLKPGARIYFEWPAGTDFDLPSSQLEWLRRKKAGQVEFGLAQFQTTD